MIALLESSRPCVLRLARKVASLSMFVGVLLILTSLFTIEGFAQTPTTPGKPTGLTATGGDGKVDLSWTAPSDTGSHPINHYEFELNGGSWISTSSTSTTYTVSSTSIKNGTTYTFKVRARNQNGGGAASDAVTATPNIAAPTGLTATAGSGQVTLNWTAVSGVTTITKYQYQKDTDAWADTSANTSHTVTGLTDGTQYAFKVRAFGAGGGGTASASKSATPRVPEAATSPIGITLTPGDKQIEIKWTAPIYPGTHTITDYKYVYSTSDPTNHPNQAWTSIGSTNTSYTITGLTNGISYTIRIRAVSGAGDGAVGQAGTAIPTIPAPTNFTAAAGDGEVRLSWTPPTVVSGSPLTDYDYSKDDGANWATTGGDGTISTYIVTELTNGTPYTFKVRAVRNTENGAVSEAKSATPQAGVQTPPPPQQVQSSPVETEPATEQTPPKRRIRYECPVGWTRGSVFGKTKKALIYELKVEADTANTTSIYQLKSLAIYVHPDEGLDTLNGWTLQIGTLYNQFGKEFKLTAENSVIDEHNFAHIENPEDIPIPMGTLGYIGQSLPSFDYRLYDAAGVRVDFGISCYKAGGLTWRLWNTKDPRLLRVLPLGKSEAVLSVQMNNLNWQTPFFRSEWTAAIMPDLPAAPAAPSLIKKNIIGTWADLKKQ